MAEVFTISGAEPYEMGAPADECAHRPAVKYPAIMGFGSRIGALPIGLFGVYRTIKPSASGSRAGGIVSLVIAAGLWGLGGVLIRSAGDALQACEGVGAMRPSPLPPAVH